MPNIGIDIDSELTTKMSPTTLESIAAVVVQAYNVSLFQELNQVLDRWKAAWDSREESAGARQQMVFTRDPLPFWWLAKLYLIQHCGRHIIPSSSQFNFPRGLLSNLDGATMHPRIIDWISMFRQFTEDGSSDECAASWGLIQLMEPIRNK